MTIQPKTTGYVGGAEWFAGDDGAYYYVRPDLYTTDAQQWARGEVYRVYRADRDDIVYMREDGLCPELDADQGQSYASDTLHGVYFTNGYPTLIELEGLF